jgi:hypothetical protein
MRKAVLKTAVALLSVMALFMAFTAPGANAAQGMPGSALIYTYYDVRPSADGGLGTADNYFTLTNTSTDWVQAHVRVRTGDKSVELLDFDIMLSPKDVFSWTITDDGAGAAFVSLDKGTISHTKMLAPFLTDIDGDGTTDGIILSTNPASPYFSANLTSLIMLCQDKTLAEAAALTKKGYVDLIEEGAVTPCASDKQLCSGPNNNCALTTEAVVIGLHTLSELYGIDGANALCPYSMVPASPNLHGRVYYASIAFEDGTAYRLAHLDAETTDTDLPGNGFILHANTYDAERLSPRCLAGAGKESCYAYTAATANLNGELNSASDVGGADDMNFCFYTDAVLAGTPAVLTGVQNKFGAAATFGPMLPDLVEHRDGSLGLTASALDDFSLYSSHGVFAYDGLEPYGYAEKTSINSHYLFYPSLPFRLTSAWAFIFPLQHYIGEANKVGSFTFYDMDENTVTPPTSGFISPGLPGPGSPITEEALLQTLTSAPFDEGWVTVGKVSATNKTSTTACDPGLQCPGTTNTLVRGGSVPYTPGYTGATFVTGPQALSASLLQLNFTGSVNYDY